MSELGQRLRTARENKGWTRRQLSEASGLTEKAIYAIERGDTKPLAETLYALATPLGVTCDYLMTGTPVLTKIEGKGDRRERRADRQVHTGQYLLTRPGQGSSILVSESHHPKQPILDALPA